MAIQKPIPKQGPRIAPIEPINYDLKPPIFSLERVVNGDYCFSAMDQEHKAYFGEAMFRRKSTNWGEIRKCHRHGLGLEKISRADIKAPIPNFITDDVSHFLAFRFHGLKPMVGIRIQDIFYILWFDHNFTLYDHG